MVMYVGVYIGIYYKSKWNVGKIGLWKWVFGGWVYLDIVVCVF